MRVGIYAPAKNEIKHVKEWAESCKDADIVCIADTGSTDGTRECLIESGVNVHDIRIVPWRFDDAFNCALYLLPEDIDVCIRLDLDERLQPGWRNALEKSWTPETTRLRYEYVWNWNADGTPGRKWWGDRIHSRKNYRWMGATHEGLYCRGDEVQTYCEDVKIWQFPDIKQKSGDLSLLLESKREQPHDSRVRAYLAREYMYRGDYTNSTKTYKEFLEMTSDAIEKGQALLNLSITDPKNANHWLTLAQQVLPTHREPLLYLGQILYNNKKWVECYDALKKCISIVEHPMDYISTPEAWGSLPHDLLSIACWNLNYKDEAILHAEIASKKDPSNLRIINNINFMVSSMNHE